MARSYTQRTVKQLYGQASCCAFPGCMKPLILIDQKQSTVVAKIAQIRSPAPGMPRHDPTFKGDFNGPDNLLLLCGAHYAAVDQRQFTYSISALERWKAAQIASSGVGTAVDDKLARTIIHLEVRAATSLEARELSSSETREPSSSETEAKPGPKKKLRDRSGLVAAITAVAAVAVLPAAYFGPLPASWRQDVADLMPWHHTSRPALAISTPGVGLAALPGSVTPASASDPPLLIESVNVIDSWGPPGTGAVRAPLNLTVDQLNALTSTVYPNTASYAAWVKANDVEQVGETDTTIQVRGNWPESLSISNIRVHKTCQPPASGTYFQGYTQGGGPGPVVRIGFDLDGPQPVAEELAQTQGRGLAPDGNEYFAVNAAITVQPTATQSIILQTTTNDHDCSFTYELDVASSKGTYSETITDDGQPFRLTAKAPIASNGHPLSGYADAYVLGPNGGNGPEFWRRVVPATFDGVS